MAIAITREDESAADLRRMARLCRNVAQARRLLAIASVMDGRSRTEAAASAGLDRQSLRDWVHRFNAEGPSGLRDKPRRGRPPRLSEDQLKDLDAVVEAAPDLETDGVVRWRCADLQRVISEKHKATLGERSVGRILNDRGFRHMSVRPRHPKSDPAARGRVPYTRYAWAYLFGTVCPERAVGAGLAMPHANTEAMSPHLVEISEAVSPGAHAALVMDGAGWHVSDKLVIPDNITLVKLPPYAPELHPIENVWAYLRGTKLAHRLFESYDDIVTACCDAWNGFMTDRKTVFSPSRLVNGQRVRNYDDLYYSQG